MITHRSSTQEAIALSSVEAELDAATKARTGAWGFDGNIVCQGFGEDLGVRAPVDVQVTMGRGHRSGCGKTRHIEIVEMWIQGAS